MSSTPNVTTPGGFLVGLGGIVSFSVVAAAVFFWVKRPATDAELRPQQVALGLRAADDAKIEDVKKKEDDTSALLSAAAQRYNGGVELNLDRLDDLRGVVRYREAQKTIAEAGKALTGAPAWKDKAKGEVTMPVDLAMKVVANSLKDRKPKASAVKVDVMPVLDPNAAPMMPNAMGGGAKTVIFADPNAVAAPVPAPAAAPNPVPATPPAPPAPAAAHATPAPTAPAAPPAAPVPAAKPAAVPSPAKPSSAPAKPAPSPGASSGAAVAPSTVAKSVPAPARPTLLNWPESKK
ncbi:MAG: hypothetical protein ABI318_14075 [Chthoniobacteraceae bacterium]